MKSVRIVRDRCPQSGEPVIELVCDGCEFRSMKYKTDRKGRQYKVTYRCSYNKGVKKNG